MRVFTDGSVNTRKRAGWGYVATNSGRLDTTDTYEAELMGIVKAAEEAAAPFCLVTDHWEISKSLRQMLDKPDLPLPRHYPELWQRIHDRLPMIQGVEWMRRCSTHEMKLADKLASEAYER